LDDRRSVRLLIEEQKQELNHLADSQAGSFSLAGDEERARSLGAPALGVVQRPAVVLQGRHPYALSWPNQWPQEDWPQTKLLLALVDFALVTFRRLAPLGDGAWRRPTHRPGHHGAAARTGPL